MKILVLNSGSSSQKTALFELEPDAPADPVPPLWEGKLEWDVTRQNRVIRNSRNDEIRDQAESPQDRQASIEDMLRNLWSGPTAVLGAPPEVAMVGHRIVHGGPKLTQPIIVDDTVKEAITSVSEIAPLHNQAGLQGIELIERLFPNTRQVAVFDTGFHQ